MITREIGYLLYHQIVQIKYVIVTNFIIYQVDNLIQRQQKNKGNSISEILPKLKLTRMKKLQIFRTNSIFGSSIFNQSNRIEFRKIEQKGLVNNDIAIKFQEIREFSRTFETTKKIVPQEVDQMMKDKDDNAILFRFDQDQTYKLQGQFKS
ncbi:unnamed protein product (macronuclear) [Paramecium tetraurelia]|uniref:Uncharacterized protein n=1 Tax=Paramecium tetraurelia TaxID=5888 RepID=A0DDH2_PARTE|nr:uncharacterized protein GSPATT00015948001 [Paramecium tetraurelia]CAK81089.1 unnamed protein product [Paramecium tetraurelia]|eukprot:XP_001448486.1 hypothetical protein (macronuclear) [Paramecium tetraurelia strain d4-2]